MCNSHLPLPDFDELRERLAYDPLTGILTWKIPPTGRKVDVAGRVNHYGYIDVGFNGKIWKAHRLIWGIYYNVDPRDLEVDHKNRIRNDNRIENLRLATILEQRMNWLHNRRSSSGVRGVKKRPYGRWNASIRVNGVTHNLGNYKTFEEAVEARYAAEEKFYGAFRAEV